MAEYNRRPDVPGLPRLSGNAQLDFLAMTQYLTDLFKLLAFESGLFKQASGNVVVSENAVSVAETFAIKQDDVNYSIVASAASFTGAPVAASFVVKSIQKAVDGFVLTIFLAPGAGNSVSFDWQLQR